MASPIREGEERLDAPRWQVWWFGTCLTISSLEAHWTDVIFCSSTKAYITARRLDVKHLYSVKDFGLGRSAPASTQLQWQLLTAELEVPKHLILSWKYKQTCVLDAIWLAKLVQPSKPVVHVMIFMHPPKPLSQSWIAVNTADGRKWRVAVNLIISEGGQRVGASYLQTVMSQYSCQVRRVVEGEYMTARTAITRRLANQRSARWGAPFSPTDGFDVADPQLSLPTYF